MAAIESMRLLNFLYILLWLSINADFFNMLSNQANSFNILDFYNLNLPLETQIYIFLAFLIAFGIKIPMWPVRPWLPDACRSAILWIRHAVLLKVGGYGLIRFLCPPHRMQVFILAAAY